MIHKIVNRFLRLNRNSAIQRSIEANSIDSQVQSLVDSRALQLYSCLQPACHGAVQASMYDRVEAVHTQVLTCLYEHSGFSQKTSLRASFIKMSSLNRSGKSRYRVRCARDSALSSSLTGKIQLRLLPKKNNVMARISLGIDSYSRIRYEAEMKTTRRTSQ